MACCDCDYCPDAKRCNWVYDNRVCRVEQIKAAKAIVNDDYKNAFSSILKKNEDMCDERIDSLLTLMREIMCDSYQDLPEWTTE